MFLRSPFRVALILAIVVLLVGVSSNAQLPQGISDQTYRVNVDLVNVLCSDRKSVV